MDGHGFSGGGHDGGSHHGQHHHGSSDDSSWLSLGSRGHSGGGRGGGLGSARALVWVLAVAFAVLVIFPLLILSAR
ncbi:hypothetical protein [Kitasatospora azatica]|uniref:hypothetical protein n=1 Tax=Kitasatospora azatica TaxID=58347 RepID=UPI000565B212|nr:hypothetical protein [Kitasatospora azatica]